MHIEDRMPGVSYGIKFALKAKHILNTKLQTQMLLFRNVNEILMHMHYIFIN